MWWLYTVGVKSIGRPAMAYVNTVLFMIAFAVAGWFAGYVLSGWNVIVGVCGAFGLVILNAPLFYAKRDYLHGEEAAEKSEPVDEKID
jgi:hypothetical protein